MPASTETSERHYGLTVERTGHVYIVTEDLEGEELKTSRKGQLLPIRETLILLATRRLEYAHRKMLSIGIWDTQTS
jgi:hypothetical protein